MEDDMCILDGLAVEVLEHRDLNVRRGRRGLVFAAAIVIALGAERERAERKANAGQKNADGKMQSLEHAGILSRSKVWGETVLAARGRMSREKTGMPAAINLSALFFANKTIAFAT
jgi:hypothetical protein